MILNMRALDLPTAAIPSVFLLPLLVLLFPTPSLPLPVSSSPYTNAFSFSFPNFDPTSPLDLYGDARLDAAAGAVRMLSATTTNSSSAAGGLLLYARPLDFGRKPTFSAAFDFSISPHRGNGLAFFAAPAGLAAPADLAKDRGVPPGVFAVEFDTAMDAADADINDNHVGVDIGSAVSVRAFNVSAAGMVLASGERMRAWIDFDGDKVGGLLEIRINRSGGYNSSDRPALPFASCHVDLAGVIWQQAMLLGIRTTASSSSSSFQQQLVTIYSWNFSLTRAAPYHMHSEPLDPGQPFGDDSTTAPKQIPVVVVQQGPANGGDFYTPNILMALALGAACGAAIALLIVLLCSAKVERHPVAPLDDYHSANTPADFGYEKIVVLTDLSAKDEAGKDSSTKCNTKPLG